MKVTPLDLRQTQFRTVMRGYDRTEVRAFLTDTADDLEQSLREIDRLRQELMRVESSLAEHRERETSLRNTLLTAQRLADQIRENAEQESRMKLRDAETRADLLLQKARARAEELERGITEVKRRRQDVAASVESSIGVLRQALDQMRAQERETLPSMRSAPAAGASAPTASAATAGVTAEEEEMLSQLRRLAREEEQRAASIPGSVDE